MFGCSKYIQELRPSSTLKKVCVLRLIWLIPVTRLKRRTCLETYGLRLFGVFCLGEGAGIEKENRKLAAYFSIGSWTYLTLINPEGKNKKNVFTKIRFWYVELIKEFGEKSENDMGFLRKMFCYRKMFNRHKAREKTL